MKICLKPVVRSNIFLTQRFKDGLPHNHAYNKYRIRFYKCVIWYYIVYISNMAMSIVIQT